MMIARRNLLVGSTAFWVSPGRANAALPVPAANSLSFAVFREDTRIGTHALSFALTGDTLVVKIAIDLSVGLGPITLYRYTHRGTETWSGDTFISLETTTNDNGKPYKVSVQRQSDGLAVQATGMTGYTAPPNALPATHWNRRMLDGPIVNSQSGKLMSPQIAKIGLEQVRIANGTTIPATHYALSGDVTLDTWYDDTPSWVSLAFKGDDGSAIRYARL
jgi:hypothetical protein